MSTWLRWLLLLLLLIPSSVLARASHGVPDGLREQQAYWGDAQRPYVVHGCTHGPAAAASGVIATCAAYVRDLTDGVPQLRYVVDEAARSVAYSAGDGTYWLGVRATPGVVPSGWTCTAGTHYCVRLSPTQPATVPGLLLVQQTTVSGGVVTAADPLTPQPTGTYLPERFGAQGNGVTDDTAAFQALIAAMGTRGGVVELARGATYHLNTAGGVVFPAPVALRGAGMAHTTVTCGPGIGNAPCLTLRGAGSRVSDLAVVGEHSMFTNANLYTAELRAGVQVEGDDTWVERVKVTNAISGIRFQGPPAAGPVGGGIVGCRLLNTLVDYDYPTACTNHAGITVFGTRQTTIRDNFVTGHGQGINGSADGRYVHVSGNLVEHTCDAGIYFGSTDHTTFAGNTVLRFKGSGLKIRGTFNTMTGNFVSSETTATPGAVGLYMSGYLPPVDGINAVRLLMTNNNVLCDCNNAIFMGNDSTVPEGSVRDGLISNNIVRMLGAGRDPEPSTASGIRLQSVARQITVSHNIIQDAPYIGIRTDGGGVGPMRNITILGNVIDTVGTPDSANKGMHLQDITGCLVANNIIQNVLENDPGIHLLTVQDCDVVNNHVGSTTTPPSTGTILTESSGQVGLANTYRNNRTTGVTFLTYSIQPGSRSRVESNETLITLPLSADFTIQPGQAQRWLLTPTGGTRTIFVSPVWPATDVMLCNRSTDGSNLVFAPLTDTIVPNACAWYQATNPATFFRFAPTP